MPAFFADECVARLIVEGIRERGFDVIDAREVCQGDTDERVLSIAAAAGRIVITDDWGFGEMTVRHGSPCAGIIILSLQALPWGVREVHAVGQISRLAETAPGKLIIIEPGRVRMRQLPGAAV